MAEQLKPSGIGGQAVMEGVMMRNRTKYAVAVRKPDGQTVINVKEYHSIIEKHPWLGWPFIRGAVNLVESLIVGMGTLMYSANFADEADPKKEKKPAGETEETAAVTEEAAAVTEEVAAVSEEAVAATEESTKDDTENKPMMTPAMIGVTVALSLVMTIALFILLPFAITSLLERVTGIDSPWFSSVMEGVLRIAIFIGYVALISQLEEIKRVFRYHGAEHKTINCIEHGLELTVENARVSSKEHKRCGTSFMIFVMVISILVFSVVNLFPVYTGSSQILRFLTRFVVRILLLPLVAGISYEFLKLAGRTDNRVVNILSRPGMWMQALTTKEPDDSMLAVAITSVEAVFDWKAFLEGKAAEECATPTGVGEYLLEEDGSFTPTVTGFLTDAKASSSENEADPQKNDGTRGHSRNMTEQKPKTYREAVQQGCEALQKAGVPEALLQAQQLLWYACGMTPADWLMRREEAISDGEWETFSSLIEKRLTRIPMQYLTGEQEFMGLPFRVSPAVLIPRQDTEHLVEESLACCEGKRVLDMCTGSGCIAISIAKLGKPASVTGADISPEALAVAKENAERIGAEVAWVESDMFAGIAEEFDVIVSNPPYIPPEQIAGLEPEVKDYEPRIALYGGEDGLDYYRVLVTEGAKRLRPAENGEEGGILMVEIGFDQGVSVPALFREAGFSDVRVKKDYAGLDRVVVGHL